MSLALGPGVAVANTPWPLGDLGVVLARDRPVTAPAGTTAPSTAPLIAVVDTGADLDHPALAGQLWSNPDDPVNGRDDDRNGFVDDRYGVNLVDPASPPHDDFGHGTAVTGILVARSGWRGQAGIAPGARVLVVKALDGQGRGSAANVARGIDYAVAAGAQVINLSVLMPEPDEAVERAIVRAGARGVLVVTAAGNDTQDLSVTPVFPAAYHLSTMVTVAAAGAAGALLPSSAYGRLVDVAAPGQDIPTLATEGRVGWLSGSSAAAPFVSGAAALLWARHPAESVARIRSALLRGSARSDSLADAVRFGMLNVDLARRQLDRVRARRLAKRADRRR